MSKTFMIKLKHFHQDREVAGHVLLPLEDWTKVTAFESFCAGMGQVHVIVGQEGCCLLDVGQRERILEGLEDKEQRSFARAEITTFLLMMFCLFWSLP